MIIKASEIEKAVREQCGGIYNMSLVGDEAHIVERIVNEGIDSHLEACFLPSRGDSYEWVGQKYVTKLFCEVSAESLPVLLRRLIDDDIGTGEEGCDTWEGSCLASDILGTLGWQTDCDCVGVMSRTDEDAEVKDAQPEA